MSAHLFNVYVDAVINKLADYRLGCFIGNLSMNSLMYADDLIILAISVQDLQSLVNLCLFESNTIIVLINAKKSSCLKVGKRFNANVCPITASDEILPWTQEIQYLGIVISAARSFVLNLQNIRHKYCRSLNSIFGRVGGLNTSIPVLISLIESQCVRVLTYAWKKSLMADMEKTYSQGFYKIFKLTTIIL